MQCAVVVLDQPLADHHVADAQRRVEPAGDAGEQQAAATELRAQQGRRQRGCDLADAALDQHHRLAVEPPSREVKAADGLLVAIAQRGMEMLDLLRQRADDAERPSHGPPSFRGIAGGG